MLNRDRYRHEAHLAMARRKAGEIASQGSKAVHAALVDALYELGAADRDNARLLREIDIGFERFRREVSADVLNMYKDAGLDDPGGTFSRLEAARAQLHHDQAEFGRHRAELIEAKRQFKLKRKRADADADAEG